MACAAGPDGRLMKLSQTQAVERGAGSRRRIIEHGPFVSYMKVKLREDGSVVIQFKER